jgi:hypothetical protein
MRAGCAPDEEGAARDKGLHHSLYVFTGSLRMTRGAEEEIKEWCAPPVGSA